ncbi:zinc-dependent metalloprotease [Verrucomicrobiales bacterium]|nr:zinc-dependent metalloprotease [Verrucomicrobiales bacterium]MDA7666391.1 zinc-dependent metalloprotease [bacterium]
MNSHLLSRSRRHASGLVASVALLGASLALSPLQAADAAALPAKQSDFPPPATVLKDYKQIVSTVDGKSLYKLYRNPKTSHMLAELPRDFANQKHFIALTISSGESYAGLQAGDLYVKWEVFNQKRLALVQPNLETRSTGDDESKSSVKRLFTDRIILDIPILTYQVKGGPIIDLDALLLGKARSFFGSAVSGIQPQLFKAVKHKAFPENIEVAFEVPINDTLKILHYSIKLIKPNKEYKPRKADERIGYFTTNYRDFGQFKPGTTRTRYINRWHLEKADKSLKLSPPKQPIVFYLEHTTPIRYRRWVADGVLAWNKAFENIGIVNAIEVRYQDAKSGQYMDLDPEDARYNFVRWLNNGIGTAIGPSRVNPETGQILDADIILTDGWIRHWWTQYQEILPEVAMEGYTPDTMAWLERNPRWDPRIRLAEPSKREEILRERQLRGASPMGGHAFGKVDNALLGDQEFDGLSGRVSQVNGLCMAANCKTHGLAQMHMMTQILAHDTEGDKEGEEKKDEKKVTKDKEQLLDGIPESFIGPLLVDLVAHEVGHTIGLRHNFKGSSIYDYSEINSKDLKGKKPFASTVMDYIPVNMRMDAGEVQGDYGMISVGPYDMWAIEYGYTFDKDLKPILKRAGEPELQYATDEDTYGPDPLARRYDFAKDPLDYVKDQMLLVEANRGKLIDKFVKDGESWAKVRRGYLLTLSAQTRAVSMMANWVGGTHVYRHRKGDSDRRPIEVVPAEKQRDALKFVIKNAFGSKAYGLSPKLLTHMSLDKWWGEGNISDEATWPVHDRVLGIQASALTSLMNPTTLMRIYDNEFRTPPDEDAFTLPEMLNTLTKSIWKEIDDIDSDGEFTARKPLIGSFERNLQREYVERLTDLIAPSGYNASQKSIYDLASTELHELAGRLEAALDADNLDPYTKAHLNETHRLIEKSLDASVVLDVKGGNLGGGSMRFLFGQDPQTTPPRP